MQLLSAISRTETPDIRQIICDNVHSSFSKVRECLLSHKFVLSDRCWNVDRFICTSCSFELHYDYTMSSKYCLIYKLSNISEQNFLCLRLFSKDIVTCDENIIREIIE